MFPECLESETKLYEVAALTASAVVAKARTVMSCILVVGVVWDDCIVCIVEGRWRKKELKVGAAQLLIYSSHVFTITSKMTQ